MIIRALFCLPSSPARTMISRLFWNTHRKTWRGIRTMVVVRSLYLWFQGVSGPGPKE